MKKTGMPNPLINSGDAVLVIYNATIRFVKSVGTIQ